MSPSPQYPIDFREVQQFRQPWLWTLLILLTLAAIVCFGYGMIKQLLFGYPWGSRPLPNGALAIVGPLFIILMIGISFLFLKMKLITEVRDDGLYIHFFPLLRQHIRFENIENCEVRSYSPIKEYGGWGIRYGLKGKAYNVSGNHGVQLKLAGDKRLLIGSQRPEELAHAIAVQMEKQDAR